MEVSNNFSTCHTGMYVMSESRSCLILVSYYVLLSNIVGLDLGCVTICFLEQWAASFKIKFHKIIEGRNLTIAFINMSRAEKKFRNNDIVSLVNVVNIGFFISLLTV